VPLVDRLFAAGPVRQAVWRLWYPYLTRRLRRDDVLFLNYAFEEPAHIEVPPLGESDEPNRACIQLYHHVGAQTDLRGKRVLEVSCGHGGGASYLTRTFQPKAYVGLDLNPAGIAFCRERYRVPRLSFVRGDAIRLPFADASVDAVVNVEASHCYPNFPAFLDETARVLVPGGSFLYADFRFSDGLDSWNDSLLNAPLSIVTTRDIGAEVRRGMDRNSARSLNLVNRHLPRFLHGLGRDFAGVQGSRIYRALVAGELRYQSGHWRK
jgi:SAM-dependent methyltransferase